MTHSAFEKSFVIKNDVKAHSRTLQPQFVIILDWSLHQLLFIKFIYHRTGLDICKYLQAAAPVLRILSKTRIEVSRKLFLPLLNISEKNNWNKVHFSGIDRRWSRCSLIWVVWAGVGVAKVLENLLRHLRSHFYKFANALQI